jgi:hypothetical protein
MPTPESTRISDVLEVQAQRLGLAQSLEILPISNRLLVLVAELTRVSRVNTHGFSDVENKVLTPEEKENLGQKITKAQLPDDVVTIVREFIDNLTAH